MRVDLCEKSGKCIKITDKATGISATGTGANQQEAIADVSKKLFGKLISLGILSMWDLCYQFIVFPHPNQTLCPGVTINPCDLIHPVETTPRNIII